MGKSRVKGIVIQIGGDTVGLDKALKGTNDQIYATQSKLKDVERLLKLDPKNTVLLEQKQRLLAQAVADTESKLETLNTTNEQMKGSLKNYDAWKAAITPVQDEIDATTKKLKDLKQQQSEMKDCGEVDTDAYKLLTEEIENTSKKLKDLKDRAKEVNDQFGNPASPEQFDALQREIAETQQNLRKLADEAKDTEKKINGIDERPVDDVADAANKTADALDNASDKASQFGDVLKAEVIVEGAKGIVSTLRDVADETKEYRKIMGSLEVSSEAAGYSADQTQEAYKALYGVLADDQSAATTLANLQALNLSQEELLGLIDGVIGGWAKYGDSIPVDGLAEAINETVKSGQVTGSFADILNWGAAEGENYGQQLKDLTDLQAAYDAAVQNGESIHDYQIEQLQKQIGLGDVWDESVEKMEESEEKQVAKLKAMIEAGEAWNKSIADSKTSEDMFNIALQQCNSESERVNLIMKALAEQGLSAVGQKWKDNNATLVEANEVNADLQDQLAELGEKIEPLATRLTKFVTEALEWFNNLDAGTQDTILCIVAMIAALGPLGVAFSGVSSVVNLLLQKDLPGLESAFGLLTGKVLPGLQEVFSSVFGNLTGIVLPGVQNGFSSVFGFIINHPVVLLIAAIVGLVALIATKGDEIQAVLQKVDDFLQGVFATDWTEIFGPVLGESLNGFFAMCKNFWDALKQIFDGIIDFIRGVFTGDWERAWRGVVGIFQGIFSGLEAILKAPVNGVISLVNTAISGINGLIEGANKIPGIDIPTIGKIPYLADGGEVLRGSAIVGEAGPELLTVMGDRTVVQPLSQTTTHTTHLGGVNLHVYGAPGQNVRELAEIVMEEMQGICDSEEAGL